MASGQSSLGPRPLTIPEITASSQRYEYNPKLPLKAWFRVADRLLREGHIYETEGNYEQSYLLFMRYIDLVFEKLQEHPEAKLPEYRAARKEAIRTVQKVAEKLEALKPKVERRQEEYAAKLATEEEAERAAFEGNGLLRQRQAPSAPLERNPVIAGRTKMLAPKDYGDIPFKLYQRESRRRDDAKRTARDRGSSRYGRSDRPEDDVDLHRDMEDTRRRMDSSLDGSFSRPRKLTKSRSPTRTFNNESPANNYTYPTIKKSQPFSYDDRPSPYRSIPALLPQVPGKEALINPMSYDNQMRPPSRPEKVLRDESPASRSLSPVDDNYTFSPSAYLENGNPLRHVFLPPSIRTTFLSIAAKNTRANIETCGMLCGTLMSNALFITHLVIPEQEGSSDTCEMTNENALFEFCDKENLIVLGWIHTHPSQSCFMSSRDLHTHSGFQVMMPEAIAIVCAPTREPSYGVFRLSDPPGIQNVLNCNNPGIFHPHPEIDTYTSALKPGHVYETEGIEIKTVDLRPFVAR